MSDWRPLAENFFGNLEQFRLLATGRKTTGEGFAAVTPRRFPVRTQTNSSRITL
jgi:hypothetical protein